MKHAGVYEAYGFLVKTKKTDVCFLVFYVYCLTQNINHFCFFLVRQEYCCYRAPPTQRPIHSADLSIKIEHSGSCIYIRLHLALIFPAPGAQSAQGRENMWRQEFNNSKQKSLLPIDRHWKPLVWPLAQLLRSSKSRTYHSGLPSAL